MKRLYWREARVSRTVLVFLAVLALLGLFAVERLKRKVQQPYYKDKMAAARIAEDCFRAIQEERARRGIPLDKESDPAQTGLIGELMTPVTTNPGSLAAKQTSINPNFAAVIVEYLRKGGVQKGDVIAVGYSSSFPGLNVNVLAAAKALELKPIIITSQASSQWGANIPELLWLDMEDTLFERGLISARSIAASIGGIEDRGLGMSKRGRTILADRVQRAGIRFLEPRSYAESVELRHQTYRAAAGNLPIKAYVNVGGGTTSVGKRLGKKAYKPGLNRSIPEGAATDSVMSRFVEEGVPVVHLTRVAHLAKRHGLPIQPATTPPPGQGQIFYRDQYDPWLAAGVLVAILFGLFAFFRSDLGFRLLRIGPPHGQDLEPMI